MAKLTRSAVLAALLVWELILVATTVTAFVPLSRPSHGATSTFVVVRTRANVALLDATKKQLEEGKGTTTKTKDDKDWVATWMSDLQEWWDTTVMHHPHEQPAATTAAATEPMELIAEDVDGDKDWVAKEFIEMGEQDVDEITAAVPDVKASEVTPSLTTPAEPLASDKPKPKPKVQKATYEWLTKDMIKAGKGEREREDWVADDMKRMGKVGPLHDDWVAQDMKEAGEAGIEGSGSKLRTSKTKVKTETDKIAEGMKKAGRASGAGWIAQDMKEAGTAQEKHSYAPWTDRLRNQLDREHEKRYDDVYKGMEKAGAKGSMASDWVEEDMVRAGKAESILDRLKSSISDVTYKLEGWQKDRYDTDKVRENVETAGHAEAQDWIANDMSTTGQNRSTIGRSYPAPEKDLREWLNVDERSAIAVDMEAEGKALGSRRTRKEKISRSKLTDLVARDMEVVGTTSANWVETDMERTGRAEPHLNQETFGMSHRQRETEAFMSTRKPKLAEVRVEAKAEPLKVELEPPSEEAPSQPLAVMEEPFLQLAGGATPADEPMESEHHHHRFLHSLARATKKVLMPWRAWHDIE